MTERVLIAGSGDDTARSVEAAKRTGIEAAVFDGAEAEPESLADAARTFNAGGVYSASESHTEPVAAAADKLGLPCLSARAARLLRDKEALRIALARHSHLNPRYGVADSLAGTEKALRNLGVPAVVKPADGTRGRGALIVEDIDEAPLAFARAAKAASNGRILVEAHLRGQEYRVICHCGEGTWRILAIFSNVPADNGHLFDRALVAPVRAAGPLRDRLFEGVRAAMRAAGRLHGIVVLEFMVSNEGLYLLELSHINAVPALAERLFPGICGVNLLDTDVACFAGKPFNARMRYTSCGAVWWAHARSGVVSAVRGEDAARSVPGVWAVEVRAAPGVVLGHQVDGPSRDAAAFIVALARSPRRALEKAQYAAECLYIETSAALGG